MNEVIEEFAMTSDMMNQYKGTLKEVADCLKEINKYAKTLRGDELNEKIDSTLKNYDNQLNSIKENSRRIKNDLENGQFNADLEKIEESIQKLDVFKNNEKLIDNLSVDIQRFIKQIESLNNLKTFLLEDSMIDTHSEKFKKILEGLLESIKINVESIKNTTNEINAGTEIMHQVEQNINKISNRFFEYAKEYKETFISSSKEFKESIKDFDLVDEKLKKFNARIDGMLESLNKDFSDNIILVVDETRKIDEIIKNVQSNIKKNNTEIEKVSNKFSQIKNEIIGDIKELMQKQIDDLRLANSIDLKKLENLLSKLSSNELSMMTKVSYVNKLIEDYEKNNSSNYLNLLNHIDEKFAEQTSMIIKINEYHNRIEEIKKIILSEEVKIKKYLENESSEQIIDKVVELNKMIKHIAEVAEVKRNDIIVK